MENTGTGVKATFLTNHEGTTGLYDRSRARWYILWAHEGDTGVVYGGDKAYLETSGEGGNLDLKSPDGSFGVQMDCHDNHTVRMYTYDVSPWAYLSDIGYNKIGDYWWVGSALKAHELYENGVMLSDKYVQQYFPENKAYYTTVNTAANNYRMWRILQITDQIATKRICIVCLTFLNVPAGGTIKYFIGVGSLDCTYLYSNYNASGYKARLKGTATNDSSVSNNVSVCHAVYVADATVGTDWIRVELAPSYAYGSGTNYNPVMAAITKC